MLNGAGLNINGIQNSTAQSSSVDHVTLFQVLGTGLAVSALYSGQYTNITFDSGSRALTTTTCASISSPTGTQGIRGLTCIAGTANTAIYLDAPNNSLEDVRIAGFYDGVLVGSNAAAKSNVLFNIFGDTIVSTNVPAPVNVIHISSNNPVTDLSVMGVNTAVTSTTIKDDLTSTTLSDPYVAMYVLGKPLMNGSTVVGYSRFTTSPNAATWAAGTAKPAGACNAQTAGSLYSNTAPTGTAAALYVCPVGGGTWKSVP